MRFKVGLPAYVGYRGTGGAGEGRHGERGEGKECFYLLVNFHDVIIGLLVVFFWVSRDLPDRSTWIKPE